MAGPQHSLIAKIARAYVIIIAAAELLLHVASLVMNGVFWVGWLSLPEQYGLSLCLASVLVGIPIMFLPKDRAVWTREFKRCPIWLRRWSLASGTYGIVVAFGVPLLKPTANSFNEIAMQVALPLAFDAMPLFIVYAIIKYDWRSTDTVKRSLLSLTVAVGGAIFLILHHISLMR